MMSCFQKKSIATAEKLAEIKIVPVLVLNSVEEGLKVGEILDLCLRVVFLKRMPMIIFPFLKLLPWVVLGLENPLTLSKKNGMRLEKKSGRLFLTPESDLLIYTCPKSFLSLSQKNICHHEEQFPGGIILLF